MTTETDEQAGAGVGEAAGCAGDAISVRIDAKGLHYRELNERIHQEIQRGVTNFDLANVNGQRYIGAGLNDRITITIHGVPGNDLAAFMNGAELIVRGNVQDGVGNTMNAGRVIIHGDSGDILGHSMRGGKIFVRGYAGYRCGIHMKAFQDRYPVLVIGETAGDYLGEYMAGGVLIVLGLDTDRSLPVGDFIGTGMHGGAIYLRGDRPEDYRLGAEVGVSEPTDEDWATVSREIADFGTVFGVDPTQCKREEFWKLTPFSSRPYGNLYAY